MAGQAIGQLSLIAAMPVLTRSFTTSEIGQYELALAVGVVLQPLASLRLEFVIPSAAGVQEFQRLRHISLISRAAVMGIYALVATATNIVVDQQAAKVVVMMGIVTAAYAWTAIDNSQLVRNQDLSRLTWRNLLSGLCTAGFQIANALTLNSVLLLAVSILCGRGVAILLTKRYGSAEGARGGHDVISIRWNLKRAVYAVSSGLVSSASLRVLVIYSSMGFGSSAAGFVGIAQRSAAAPVSLVSQGLSQYTQSTLAPLVRTRDSRLREATIAQVRLLIPWATLTVIALAIFGPILAGPILGEQWAFSGTLIAIFALPSGLQLLISPVIPVFIMLAREKHLFWIQCFRLAFSLALATGLQLLTNQLIFALIGYSAGTCIAYALTFILLLRQIKAWH